LLRLDLFSDIKQDYLQLGKNISRKEQEDTEVFFIN